MTTKQAARLLVLATWMLGCAAPAPGPAIPASQMFGHLEDGLAEESQRELELRSEADPTLREWIEDQGTPDYVTFPSERQALLFYVTKDLQARFSRGFMSAASDPPAVGSIRAHHHRFFSNADRERLGRLRRERAFQEELARRERSRAAAIRALPDAPAAPED